MYWVCRRLRAPGVAVFAAVLLAGLLSGCQPNFNGLRLTLAGGSQDGVYLPLGGVLAKAWHSQLGIPLPTVMPTNGSLDNIRLLCHGEANIGFSAADAAANANTYPDPPGCSLRALARMHDDYYQVVVRAESPVQKLSDLRGMRVSIGAPNSGVLLIAERLLTAAEMSIDPSTTTRKLGLKESIDALLNGTIDAFFWSGGLPTQGVSDLSKRMRLRLVDLSDVLPTLRNDHPVYGTASVPISTYDRLPSPPITTLVVRNFLLVTAAMPDDVAEALTHGIFAAQPQLASENKAARSIDQRSAIETWPVPLHPGAERYYRSSKL